MPHYNYLIIGGGMTADAAARGIREADAKGSIGIISAEADEPYDRPPLTKGLWKGKLLETVWRHTRRHKAELHLGRWIEAIDVWRRQVTDNQATSYTFDKLLLATGGRPRRLPFGGEEILYYRTLAHYRRLQKWTEKGRRFAVLGGGFIGSEVAAALALNGKEVVLIFPDKGICARLFPDDLSEFLNGYYRQKGVEVLTGDAATGLEKRAEEYAVKTRGGRELTVDGVIAGLGIQPNVELAEMAGLRVEDGIVVDEFLRTSHPDIFAAGDVAAFYSPALRRRLRVEHEDNANSMGRQAGWNMAANPQRYVHLPFFYSDLFDLGYEAVGELDARLGVVADWKEPFREGVVYYHRDDQVRGVLLWNVWGQVEAARQLISERKQFRPKELKENLLQAA